MKKFLIAALFVFSLSGCSTVDWQDVGETVGLLLGAAALIASDSQTTWIAK